MNEPIIVYSAHGENYLERNFNVAYISNFFANKHGFKTVLYTDKQNKNTATKIPYSEIIEYDESILNKLPNQVWSANKILTMSIEQRPFIHIDFDLFIFNKVFLQLVENKDFFVFHKEPWLFKEHQPNCIENFIINIANNIGINLNPELICYNFGIVGSLKEQNIKTINQTASFIIDKIIEHKNYLNNPFLYKKIEDCSIHHIWASIIPMTIEQIIFPQLLENNFKKKCTTILNNVEDWKDVYKESPQLDLFHIWFANKNNKIMYNNMDKLVKIISKK